MTTIRPRHYAVTLVSAWVRGEALPPVLAEHEQLARAHAKNFCEQIKHHARMRTPEELIKGAQMRAWIDEYVARKK